MLGGGRVHARRVFGVHQGVTIGRRVPFLVSEHLPEPWRTPGLTGAYVYFEQCVLCASDCPLEAFLHFAQLLCLARDFACRFLFARDIPIDAENARLLAAQIAQYSSVELNMPQRAVGEHEPVAMRNAIVTATRGIGERLPVSLPVLRMNEPGAVVGGDKAGRADPLHEWAAFRD